MVTALFVPVRDRMHLLRQNSLVMNAFYLMFSTLVVAASGFVFWVLVTQHYPTSAVGVATTLLSLSGLLSLLGLAGFDAAMVRFLPGLEQKKAYINSSFTLVGTASVVVALGAALLLPRISHSLIMLEEPATLAAFVFFTAISSLNILAGAVFLAFKQARYTFVITLLFCTAKVLLPLLVTQGSAATIFLLAGIAQLVGLMLNIAWIHRKCNHRFSLSIDVHVFRLVRKFSLFMYGASILNLLPPTLLPLIILHFMAPQSAAYYYMAFTIASVLYTVAYASMQSAFAEGSHNKDALKSHITRAIKLVAVLLLPAAFLAYILSGILLSPFGADYAQFASQLLQLFAMSALPVAAYSMLGAIFKVTKNLRAALVMNTAYAVAILGFSYWLVPRIGIMAVGWAWLVGNIIACIIGLLYVTLIKGGKDAKTSGSWR